MFKKLDPIKSKHIGCLTCDSRAQVLPMDRLIAVGFGSATATKDGKEVYDEQRCLESDDYWTVQDAEKEALKSPESDWRIHLVAPLYERHYQRQDKNYWVLYEEGPGFA